MIVRLQMYLISSALFVLLLIGMGYGWHRYKAALIAEGFADCRQQVDTALAEANKRADQAEAELRQVRERATLEIAQIRAARTTGRASAQRIVNANPSFAAVARPAELHDQRVRELEAVRSAAVGR